MPGLVEAVAVVVAEQEEHAGGALARPTSAWAMHAVLDYLLDCGFEGTTADG